MPSQPSAIDTAAAATATATATVRLSGEFGTALARVLDMIVPPKPSRRLPGASEVGVLDYVLLRAPEAIGEILADFERLDAASLAQHGLRFAGLAAAQQAALVDAQRAAQPAFMQRLALEAVTAYYMDARVLAAFDIEDRPPYPKGYQVIAGDLTLLAPVRKRGKIYRDA